MNLQSYLKTESAKIDKALRSYLPKATEGPARLYQAMRYAVFSGGKRIRPIFALAACAVVGGDERKVLPAACAIELIHSYSLVHDDLPCMDDAKWRRGLPACHVKFGDGLAVLTGDALLTLAFEVLAKAGDAKAISMIAEAAGTRGMVGGQALDMKFQKKEADLATLEYIHTRKSGALIAVSARVGAYLGGGNPREVEAAYRYGKCAGLLFQIVDDILDREGYAKALGVNEARRHAETFSERAKKALGIFGRKGRPLMGLLHFILKRMR